MKHLLFLGFLFTGLTSWAGDKGNGGDVIIMPDDSVVLADSFGIFYEDEREPIPQDVLFSDELTAEIKRIEKHINSVVHPFSTQAITDLIIGKDIKYYLTSQLPNTEDCMTNVAYPWAPQDGKVVRVACTTGSKTWIIKDLFVRMSLRDQGLLLLHEAFRRFTPKIPDNNIYRITNGLSVALNHLNKQLAGKREELNPRERSIYLSGVKTLLDLNNNTMSMKYWDGPFHEVSTESITIYKKGGAIILTDTQIGDNTYLGIGTSIGKNGYIVGDNVTLINTNATQFSSGISEMSEITNSSFTRRIQLERKVIIKDSTVDGSLNMAFDTKLLNSHLVLGYSQAGRGSMDIGTSSVVENVNLKLNASFFPTIKLKHSVELKNMKKTVFHLQTMDAVTRILIINSIDFKNKYICPEDKNEFVFDNSFNPQTIPLDYEPFFRSVCH